MKTIPLKLNMNHESYEEHHPTKHLREISQILLHKFNNDGKYTIQNYTSKGFITKESSDFKLGKESSSGKPKTVCNTLPSNQAMES